MPPGHLLLAKGYWTLPPALPKVRLMKPAHLFFAWLLTPALFCLSAQAGGAPGQERRAQPINAQVAHSAVARGAVVVDVRSAAAYAGERLSAAVHVPNAHALSAQELVQALSSQGVDASRELVLLGEPGDTQAQAVFEMLAAHASGRVLWLVGGVAEWAMTGLPTERGSAAPVPLPARRLAVPQLWVTFEPVSASARLAGGARRETQVWLGLGVAAGGATPAPSPATSLAQP